MTIKNWWLSLFENRSFCICDGAV